jgi:hypothetical protein
VPEDPNRCHDERDCPESFICEENLCREDPNRLPLVSNLTYSEATAIYWFNPFDGSATDAINPNRPSLEGTALAFEIIPDLTTATGLDFDRTTGIISGKPSVSSEATDYTITALNGPDSAETTINVQTAAGFVVDTANDLDDLSPDDHRCATADGDCSLRAAITQHNASSLGASGLIVVPAVQIDLGARIDVTSDVEIVGTHPDETILDGGNNFSELLVAAGPEAGVTLRHLTVQNRYGTALQGTNGAPFTLERVVFTGISAMSSAVVSISDGELHARNVSFISNGVEGWYVTPLSCEGSALCDLEATHFLSNRGGGAMHCSENTLCRLRGCRLHDNTGYDFILRTEGNLEVDGCEVSHNRATLDDAGYLSGILNIFGSGITATVRNSTFMGNFVGNNAGAITSTTVWNDPLGPTTSLIGLTIVDNSRASTSTYGNAAGIWKYRAGSLTLTNSIVAQNTNTETGTTINCSRATGTTLTSGGYNLSDTVASQCSMGEPTDLPETAADLGPLENHGGSTDTMVPQAGSAAIQGGPPVADCATLLGSSVDQRGWPRPGSDSKTHCDIGAIETP